MINHNDYDESFFCVVITYKYTIL